MRTAQNIKRKQKKLRNTIVSERLLRNYIIETKTKKKSKNIIYQ